MKFQVWWEIFHPYWEDQFKINKDHFIYFILFFLYGVFII